MLQISYILSAAKAEMNPWAAVMKGDYTDLVELLEVRLGEERNAVSLAAQRATEEDIQELERSLHEMSAKIDRGGLDYR
jgi:DNA-binding FadR family transcriptional regulator